MSWRSNVLEATQRHIRRLLILTAVASVALSACGGGTGTPSPSIGGAATGQPTGAAQAGTSDQSSSSIDGAVTAMSGLTSYKFTMTVVGGDLSDNTLSTLPNAPADDVFKISGTYIFKPAEAADIVVANAFHEISVGGADYQDASVGLTGSFTEDDSGASVLVDLVSPTSIYSSFDFSGSAVVAASESKDNIDTIHYKATDASLAEFASVAGVTAGAWTADVWIAKNGGYPVSISVVGTTSATDKTVVFERTFDLSDVNVGTNTVTAPTNINGA
jgi:hypothetical protein